MPRLLFVSEACLFDQSSGAALSARAMLEALGEAGWEVRAATLGCCDGDREYPLAEADPALDPDRNAGQVVGVQVGAVPYEVLVTQSTQQRLLRPWEVQDYLRMARARLQAFAPDVVLTYSSPLLQPLLAQAQRQGSRTVFFVANPALLRRPEVRLSAVDEVIVPTGFVGEVCRETLGREAHVIGDIVPQVFDGRINREPARIRTRLQRYVTLINPAPHKGGLFFINIAAQLAVLDPEIKCRVVESRTARSHWEALGVAAADLDRIDWHPHTRDMATVYDEAALLLVPSLGEEAAGRVMAEALLAGVPVLAMRNGGIPEVLGEGGILFDLPAALAANHLAPPDKTDLLRWSQFIQALMQKDELYARAVELALREARRHAPERRRGEVVALFERLRSQPLQAAAGDDPAVMEALAAYRERMERERVAINARVESGEHPDSGRPEDTPYLPLLQRSLAQPVIKEALAAANARQWPEARRLLEAYLRVVPHDLAALGVMADVADAQQNEHETRELLERLVELAPGFLQGQQRLMGQLRRVGDWDAALAHSEALLARAPENPRYQALHAGLLTAANRFDQAIDLYARCFRDYAGSVHDWTQYAQALKTVGSQQEAIAAYRKAIDRAPHSGNAWHGLSSMKLAVFTPDDVAYLEHLLADAQLEDDDRAPLHFALGKALEDASDYAASFHHSEQANAIRRQRDGVDVSQVQDYVAQVKEVFTAEFLAERAGVGHAAADPVFVLGMHRAGSTLVEQILASHSQVEGTRELPYMPQLARHFGGMGMAQALNADLLARLQPGEWGRLGQRYLDLSRGERVTGRPHFIDKMPFNWLHTGLIHLLLPNARIIDVRRRPMAAGFALFKMHFGPGVQYASDQVDIALYYRAYTELMAHFDALLPGRVHRMQYETLVAEPEAEIRRLLDYCGLPFEDPCLRYWETERAIQTPSAEQVRQPIFSSAVEQWTHYAEWLGPMRDAFDYLLPEAEAGLAAGGSTSAGGAG